jgi:hypothetical protein
VPLWVRWICPKLPRSLGNSLDGFSPLHQIHLSSPCVCATFPNQPPYYTSSLSCRWFSCESTHRWSCLKEWRWKEQVDMSGDHNLLEKWPSSFVTWFINMKWDTLCQNIQQRDSHYCDIFTWHRAFWYRGTNVLNNRLFSYSILRNKYTHSYFTTLRGTLPYDVFSCHFLL